MVIVKDPDEDITQLEELMFEEAYTDINSPGYWIAKDENDIKDAKAIILDGHSTLLVYTQKDQDLPWSAYNELGQYKYQVDQVGDGAILVPHTFYFEFTIGLSTKKIRAHANFDGHGISAITLPLKEVAISDFFKAMELRISEAMSSELTSIDDQIPTEAKAKFAIPSSSMVKLGMKLSLIGINTEKITIIDSTEVSHKSSEIVEEVFEEPPTKVKEQLEEEERERKEARIKKAEASAKALKERDIKKEKAPEPKPEPTPAPVPNRAVPPPPGAKPAPSPKSSAGGPPPVGGKGSSGALPPATSSAPSPSTPAAPSAGPPAPGGGPPKARAMPPPPGGSAPEPSAPPMASVEKKVAQAPIPQTSARSKSKKRASKRDSGSARSLDLDDLMEGEESMDEDMDEILLAKGMDRSSSSAVLRHTHAAYFDRMIPNKVYPILIKITSSETGVKKSVTSAVTGERIAEHEETLVIEEDTKLTIRPEFPGCLVIPQEHVVEASEDVEVKFYVTPLVTGTLDSSVKFLQHDKVIHSMLLDSKVITHRIEKWMTVLGTAASAIPMTFAFFFKEDYNSFMKDRLNAVLPSLSYLGWALPGIITGACLAISGIFYKIRSPSKTNRSLAFPH